MYSAPVAGLSTARYNRLRTTVGKILEEARSHKPMDVNLVESYWQVGKNIASAGLLDDTAYGDATLKTLAKDLDVDLRTLQRSVVFFGEYDDAPPEGLTWAHYRELLTLSDLDEREYYEELALSEGLSRDRLRMAIESDVYSLKTKSKRKASLRRPSNARYVYETSLLRIIDGDTLLLGIDVGFGIVKEQRVRLAGVNAFSTESTKGRAATQFVAERLAVADRIVVQTRRADLYGRFLAHVFYSTRKLSFLKTFSEGHHLNQQLLDEKLAMLMR